GVVAVVGFLDVPIRAVGPAAGLVAVLVEVADPGNAGTIVRTADAAGADAVVCTAGSVDLYNPKVVRASAGSLFHLPMVRDVDAEGDRGWRLIATAADLDALEQARHAVLGRKAPLAGVQRSLGTLSDGERREVGRRTNEVRGQLEAALAARGAALEAEHARAV